MASITRTKRDLVDAIAARTGHKRVVVKDVVQSFLNRIAEELSSGNRLEFRDFGVFEVRVRAPRTAQNPKTLKPVKVPARPTVKFKAGRLLREGMEQNGAALAASNGKATEESAARAVEIKPRQRGSAVRS